jgi:hypothetical protein
MLTLYAAVGWMTPAGVPIGPAKDPLNGQLSGDGFAHDNDPVKFAGEHWETSLQR